LVTLSIRYGAILGSGTAIASMEDAMCYEERYFFEWTRKAAQKRDELKSQPDRGRSDARPERAAPKPTPPKEVERELEPV